MRTSDSFLMIYVVAAAAFVVLAALWLNRRPLLDFFGQPLSGMGRGDKLLVSAATLVLVLLLTPFFYTPLYAITYGTLKAKEVRVIDATSVAICFDTTDQACMTGGQPYWTRWVEAASELDFYVGGVGHTVNWRGSSSADSDGEVFMTLDGSTTPQPEFPNGIESGTVIQAPGFAATGGGSSLDVGTGYIYFNETGGGSDYFNLRAPAAITASTTYLWPGADGSAGDSLTTDGSGNLSWAGGVFADIYANDVNLTHTIASSGQANKVQVTAFNADGVSAGMTPDHTNDHITVDEAGMYLCNVAITLDSVAGANAQFGFAVYKNNGATEFANMHCHRDLSAGAGGNSGVVALSGILDLAATDTIEVWVWNETNTQNIVVDDINLSLVKIGPT